MADPVDELPAEIRVLVRSILEREVAGGSERFRKSGDRRGLEGQKKISAIMQNAGVSKSDPRWERTNEYGKQLYYGKATPGQKARMPTSPSKNLDEGPVYTHGESFRARAEALARKFRVSDLCVGHAEHGHWLEESAANAGRTFLHPAALAAAEARAARGKGVERKRTFKNMLSSQAFCFNLFGPLAHDPSGVTLASQLFSAFIPDLVRVRSIEIEYTPAFEVFRDQSGRSGVDCDVLIEFENASGQFCVLVIETKFVEEAFSDCSHRRRNECPTDVIVGRSFSGCRYASKNNFAYWQRTAESRSLHLPIVEQHGCPFGGSLWQIWVNHTLAHAEAKRRGAERAMFAVCAPEGNEALQAGARLDDYRTLATDPRTVVFLSIERLLDRLVELCASQDAWRNWALSLRKRYAVTESNASETAMARSSRGAATTGHRRIVSWMATPMFRELVAVHQAALGSRATIYFRPTDKGLVRIALHLDAPGYIGFHKRADDEDNLFRSSDTVPTIPEIRSHFALFELWQKGVRRSSDEERGVIPWLRAALTNHLWLPELGEGWVFLHQEWRFIGSLGAGKKSDVLAVHLPTGQLGIVEFKSHALDLAQARAQVAQYAELWDRDAQDLAPLFTDLLRALGLAYGNEQAANVVVEAKAAALFVGIASTGKAVRVFRHATNG